MLIVLVGIEASIRSRGEAVSKQRRQVVSGVGEGLTVAASAKTLFRRGVSKSITAVLSASLPSAPAAPARRGGPRGAHPRRERRGRYWAPDSPSGCPAVETAESGSVSSVSTSSSRRAVGRWGARNTTDGGRRSQEMRYVRDVLIRSGYQPLVTRNMEEAVLLTEDARNLAARLQLDQIRGGAASQDELDFIARALEQEPREFAWEALCGAVKQTRAAFGEGF